SGQTPSQPVDVEYAGPLDWHVTEVLARGLPFDVELRELYRQRGRQVGYRVTVTLKPDAPGGPLKREIHLRTHDPASPPIGVLVEANVEAALAVQPSPLPLGPARVGDTLVRRAVVRGQKPFRVLAVDGLGDGLALGADLSPAALPVQTI